MSARPALGALGALTRAGVIRPLSPRVLRRVIAARRHLGESSAALAAMSAARWPHRIAIVDDDGAITYAQLHRRVAAVAAALEGAGSIAVLGRNHRCVVEAALAAGRLGADLLLLNTDFAGPQLAEVLARERPDVLVIDREFLPALGDAGPPRVVTDEDLERLACAPLTDPPPRPARLSRLTILTSGTTGRPKGAQRTVGVSAMLGVVASVVRRLDLRSGESMYVAVPQFHGYGFALSILAILLGSPLVLRRRFDPEDTAALVREHRIAFLAVVPVMLKRLLDLPPRRLDRTWLRAVLSGAAPLDPALARRALEAWGPVLCNGYGSSEAGIATIATPADLFADPASVGRPVLGTRVRVTDDGRVFVGGGMVFTGYTGGDGAGRSDERIDGLVATGDVGHVNEAGCLVIDGRADDMIVSGGENVYPQEVEDVLHEHPAIDDVAVLAVADDEFGERLACWVVRADGAALDDDAVRAFVRERLARYKVPRDVTFVDEIPRSATGKVARQALRG